ncbi:hypothetical protein ACHAW6_008585 [Cyclotella cf. meneghiniana]
MSRKRTENPCKFLACAAQIMRFNESSCECVRVLQNADEQHVFFSTWPQLNNTDAVNTSVKVGSNASGMNGEEEGVNCDANPEHMPRFTAGETKQQTEECDMKDGDKNGNPFTDERTTRSQTVVFTTTVFYPHDDAHPSENGHASDASSVPTISMHLPFPARSIICVKPLIVLDLNGILCHRVRERHKQAASLMEPLISPHHINSHNNCTVPHRTIFRKSAGRIANTEIIPRSDLAEFLHLLHQHFALAVWTSATYKTAKFLVQLLFPDHIRSRLLFVWHRSFCNLVKSSELRSCTDDSEENHHNTEGDDGGNEKKRTKKNCGGSGQVSEVKAVDNTNQDGLVRDVKNEGESTKVVSTNQFESYQEVTAIKSLSKVWSAYPLWDDSNTLLIDDSPEKCPKRFRRNAIHPPPLCGTATSYSDDATRSVDITKENKVDDDHEASDETSSKDSSTLLLLDDDEANQKLQRQFFELLAKHWSCPQMRNIDTICSPRQKLNQFLKENATPHNIRWKVG